MNVFDCDKDTLAVFDKFLAGFYGSDKIHLQNVYVNELTKCNTYSHVITHVITRVHM